MTGAMYAAIAGLRTHMQNLNVIGHNVANVNTYGYKSARSVFKTSLYTSLNGGSDGTAVLGGVNPSQIGYGATMGSVGIDMSTGNYAVTGNPTDLMLDGDGFFIVGEKTVADGFDGTENDLKRIAGMNLTRVGDFTFGADGYFSNNDGNCVYGFLCTGYYTQDEIVAGKTTEGADVPAGTRAGDAKFSDQLVPIRYPRIGMNDAGTALKVMYPEVPANNNNNNGGGGGGGHLEDKKPNAANNNNNTTAQTEYEQGTFQSISFDKNTGIITATCTETNELVTIGIIAVGQVKNPNGLTQLGDNYFQAGEGSGGLSIALLGGSDENLGLTQVNASLAATTGNGNAQGGNNANLPDALRTRKGGKTRLLSSGLEMSKTDLAQEISQMILTQRGYQANTRIITVTDSMLEELVNMKR